MSAYDSWLDKGNPLDEEDRPLDQYELRRVADRLTDIANEVKETPEAWTKGAFARSLDFTAVAADDPTAVCWSIHGFLHRDFAELPKSDQMIEAATKALHAACGTNIACYNNGLIKPQQFVNWVMEAAESL